MVTKKRQECEECYNQRICNERAHCRPCWKKVLTMSYNDMVSETRAHNKAQAQLDSDMSVVYAEKYPQDLL